MIIGICDDSKVWHKQAKEILNKYARTTGQTWEELHFYSGKEVMEYKGNPIDIMFMDIELEGENGIDVAQWMNQHWKTCQIVYLTNYLGYAVEVYKTEHTFFVLKEQFAERIGMVFEKVCRIQEQGRKALVFEIMGDVKNVVLSPEEILYFERTGRVTQLETVWGRYLLHEKMNQIMERLPETDFVRCHNSYIVQFGAIRTYEKGKFVMKDGMEIMISRSYQKIVREMFMRWSLGKES